MSIIAASLRAAREQIDIALAAIGADGAAPAGNAARAHMDDALTPAGVWVPEWLESANASYIAVVDNLGFMPGPAGPDFDGPQSFSRTQLVVASGFYFDKCLSRTDLSDTQRLNIQHWTQWAGGTLSGQRDVVTGQMRMEGRIIERQIIVPLWTRAGAGHGEYVAGVLPVAFNYYEDADQLRAAYERWLFTAPGYAAGRP